ncbi:hypothetical protein [Massilia sp. YIM B02443]|uniref:hypothetical protein n=1 Tax=Massilia sp. YIM B02443 TaxID=3050127 RepID=UPI0025B72673|nr:hypothetical protein [Massilia sp. YIM B02443]MDN4038734.1 hypothetical protein [Massilia sp. YIM B02443]
MMIATSDLSKNDVPEGDFNWSAFSKFALTFDPLSETTDESNQASAGTTPSNTWSAAALRYFLYCWQRIGNNQGGLSLAESDKVQAALCMLRTKI